MSDGYPRFPSDALLIVDTGTNHEQWTGQQWNSYAAICERHDSEFTAKLIRTIDRGTESGELGPAQEGLVP